MNDLHVSSLAEQRANATQSQEIDAASGELVDVRDVCDGDSITAHCKGEVSFAAVGPPNGCLRTE